VWAGQCHAGTGPEDWEVGDLQGENACSVNNFATAVGETRAFVSGQDSLETIHTGPYGDLPILIFSQDPVNTVDKDLQSNLSPQALAEMNSARVCSRSRTALAGTLTSERHVVKVSLIGSNSSPLLPPVPQTWTCR